MSTVDPEEIARFERVAHEWWEPNGKFKALHQLNPVRMAYICTHLGHAMAQASGNAPPDSLKEPHHHDGCICDFTGLKMLDIGCGGGILSESLSHTGANVTAIDRSERTIGAAKAHQRESGSTVEYRVQSVEEVALEQPNGFDVVLAMEVLEHVADVGQFLAACATLLKPDGLFFFSTLNRTVKAWTLAIVGAEYVLRWLPRGTHTYSKFIRPSELDQDLRRVGIHACDIRGLRYQPLHATWQLSQSPDVNYLGFGRRA